MLGHELHDLDEGVTAIGHIGVDALLLFPELPDPRPLPAAQSGHATIDIVLVCVSRFSPPREQARDCWPSSELLRFPSPPGRWLPCLSETRSRDMQPSSSCRPGLPGRDSREADASRVVGAEQTRCYGRSATAIYPNRRDGRPQVHRCRGGHRPSAADRRLQPVRARHALS